MTPSEVALTAFGGENNVLMDAITEAAIASAQQKFLRPVLGGLYGALENGQYTELLEGFVKAALAQWVKYMVLPALSAQTGALGVIQYSGQGFSGAGDKALARLLHRTRSDARALTDTLIRHIESSPDEYPEYRPKDNAANKVSIAGGVIL